MFSRIASVKWRWLLIPLGLLSLYPLYLVGLLGWILLAEVLIPRPRAAEIDRVERALAPIACIGPLDQWNRTYFYGVSDARRGTATSPAPRDRTRIEFRHYLGVGGHLESRRRVSTHEAVSYTFRHFNFKMRGVHGSYDLSTGKVEHECWEESGDDY
ncbi:MAG: hypothetical protein Q7V15_03725 [Phenylobacterium sp.]|uniref:hypothetical protein n=1 Tax=Phenylobacterium sp. TaxID=1871053 RepID=UPI00271B5A26|nr:hypothetical protein [Phenylobacterium sp.]MDO8900443.1 hypothetical protein [Phenylobacterium sp.]